MKRTLFFVAISLVAAPATSFAPASVGLANGTGVAISKIEIRDSAGGSWTAMGGDTSAGARTSWPFDDAVCGYDLRATLANGKTVEVRGINPCGATLLTLKLNGPTGWVDYD
jgi:hypothetical protein